jgi:hypothetical protein
MRLFSCHHCAQVLFFENGACMNCHSSVAYSPEASDLIALPPTADGADASFEMVMPGGKVETFRRCKNFGIGGCNWLVLTSEDQPYCLSCRLTEVIPDLSVAANQAAWMDIERAKRRLLHSLYGMRLPVISKAKAPDAGLMFRFLSDTADQKVMTGHDEGIITLNIAEANDGFRENMREKLGEGYRTVLGHLRHEIGHYYWDRLIRDSAALDACRSLFGDERESYDAALKRHYEQGAPPNWADSYISSYSTMHPWEDWAETWAHYMHMTDTLETAKSHGLRLQALGSETAATVATDVLAFRDFDSLSASWHVVSLALNNLNRSMGIKDAYPFVVSPAVQAKLRFVHDLVQNPSSRLQAQAQKAVSLQPVVTS